MQILRIKHIDNLTLVVDKTPVGIKNGYLLKDKPFTSEEVDVADEAFHGGVTYNGLALIISNRELVLGHDFDEPCQYAIGFDTAHAGDYMPFIEPDGRKWTVDEIMLELENAAKKVKENAKN